MELTRVQPEPKGPEEGSFKDRLRAHRQRLERDASKTWEIPGYDGQMFARYRRLGTQEVNEVLLGAEPSDRNPLFLAKACEEVFGCDEDGNDQHLGDHDRPLVYEKELADVLEVEADNAADVVRGVFSYAELVLDDHADEVWRWMHTLNAEADSEALGGVAGDPDLTLAARADLVGIDGASLLGVQDPLDRLVAQARVAEAERLKDERDAALIVSAVDELVMRFNGGE